MRAAAVGMFDGVHLGHQAMVRQVADYAKEQGLESTIFTFSPHPLCLINPKRVPRLLTPVDLRLDLLKRAGAQQAIALHFTESMRMMSAEQFMTMLRDEYQVRLLVVGFNHRFGHDRKQGLAEYEAIGKEIGICVKLSQEIILSESEKPVSSSLLRSTIANGGVAKAATMLGRFYEIDGAVEHGLRIGSSIGFPTANLKPYCSHQLIPANGAYACEGIVEGKKWRAMVNIGHRPTVAADLPSTIEAHLIDFKGDLYGKRLTLRFAARLRSEKQFPSLSALEAQLQADRQEAISVLSKSAESLA